MKNEKELLEGLGRIKEEIIWFKPLLYPRFLYTNGIRYLATHGECFWLLDFIFSNQILPIIAAETFQMWTIVRFGDKATITVSNGDNTIIETFSLSSTSFPLSTCNLWFIQGRLILPTEY